MGPSPQGDPIDCSREIQFDSYEQFNRPYRQASTGEEIIQFDRPTKRYGVAILYPPGVLIEDDDGNSTGQSGSEDTADLIEADEHEEGPPISPKRESPDRDDVVESDPPDFDLSLVNAYRPSAMAVSFLAQLSPGSRLRVKATGGRYIRKQVKVAGQEKSWWLRRPVALTAIFDSQKVAKMHRAEPDEVIAENDDGLDIRIEVYSRPYQDNYLLTVCLINRTQGHNPLDEQCLFQSHFIADFLTADSSAAILPYPEVKAQLEDPEEASLALLYRGAQAYAMGHGCAADWVLDKNSLCARSVSAECLPYFETPSLTPEIFDANNKVLEVSMPALAGLVEDNDGFESMQRLIEAYESWIGEREKEAETLPEYYKQTAYAHIAVCRQVARRMMKGLVYLQENQVAREAFRLANHAILLQQLRQKPGSRSAGFGTEAHRVFFREPAVVPDPTRPAKGRGKWRPFQIAFILATINSLAEDHVEERELVDLLWFPTGGGKTEAYLGLAAFAIFLRRLKDPSDEGVHVIMRYTLRLLTAQQFQRAAALICAMEYLRREMPNKLGQSEISIGIWLGGGTTPNTREEAKLIYKEWRKRPSTSDNAFVLDRCPWCRAQMGPVDFDRKRKAPKVLGYEPVGVTIKAKCPDADCHFSSGLPVYVIDEDIYEKRPSLLIGTVDKFALLAWRSDTRTIFGLDDSGERVASPPGLIIQDELHLISGPLGSMVGLYELLVEELCTDRRPAKPVRPKIVASTATIRRYTDQIMSLYGRPAQLFPPPGLDTGDSFFATYARDENGELKPGRLYVGILGSSFGSMQTVQVRTLSSLLQAPMGLAEEQRDPWWTVLTFFNSLRELGTTLSLLQSDIPDYLRAIKKREGLSNDELRWIRKPEELTGRLKSGEVPEKLRALESPYGHDRNTVDICLASNIIEVGIDIDRLSLMVVVGQPKSTSQYIQVTGRVGRKWWERPGLVVTLYTPTKPRDRSHYEQFRTYHERLYGQVEPTSVTPFAAPVLDRALHALMVAYVRQFGHKSVVKRPDPFPQDMLNQLKTIVLERVARIDPTEQANLEKVFERRMLQWQRWEPLVWQARWGDDDKPLMRAAGDYVPPQLRPFTWPVPTSLRNVDAECQAEVTMQYLLAEEEEAANHA